MVSKPSLPAAVREVAILVTGAHFRSGYELYAHVIVAEHRGLSDEKLSTIVAGQRPTDLSRQEAVAYDFASALVSGGVLPELTYRAANARRPKSARIRNNRGSEHLSASPSAYLIDSGTSELRCVERLKRINISDGLRLLVPLEIAQRYNFGGEVR